MNFRKFISGISALTIAATAFASMTVVANAEGEAHIYAKAMIEAIR